MAFVWYSVGIRVLYDSPTWKSKAACKFTKDNIKNKLPASIAALDHWDHWWNLEPIWTDMMATRWPRWPRCPLGRWPIGSPLGPMIGGNP